MEASHPIDRGLALLCSLVSERQELDRERLESQHEFFPGASLPEAEPARGQALRRHWEWFLFERDSKALGELPAFALEAELLERLGAGGEEVAASLRHSRAGIFRVAAVEPGQGLWLEDLTSRGALPIAEAEASHDLAEGELLAGRLYPLGDEQYRLSPAMAVFRDPRLAEALAADLERARGTRRGTLRIAQHELERMFFYPGDSGDIAALSPALQAVQPEPSSPTQREAALELARGLRVELELLLNDGAGSGAEGLGPERALALLTQLEREAAAPERASAAGAMEELLERVAFESDLDLESVRRLCLQYWNALASLLAAGPPPQPAASARTPAGASPTPLAESTPAAAKRPAGGLAAFKRLSRPDDAAQAAPAAGATQGPLASEAALRREQVSPGQGQPVKASRGALTAQEQADQAKAAKALSAFDQGRARGEDLDALFGQLERDLGLESDTEEDNGSLPDFPGVVGALVEEYLWEQRALGAGDQAAQDEPLLRALARSTEDLGLCEELDGARLARFAAQTVFEAQGAQPTDPLPGLERFARWIETQHGHPLWSEFSANAAALVQQLPRLAAADRLLRSAGVVGGPSAREELLQTSLEFGEQLGIRDEDGRFVRLTLEPELAANLRAGDRVQLRWSRGEPQVVGLIVPLPESDTREP